MHRQQDFPFLEMLMMRFHATRRRAVLGAGLALATAACGGDVTSPHAAPGTAPAMNDAPGAAFNPQPEPPARVVSFVVTGDPLLRMAGRFRGADEGEVVVTGIEGRRRGATLHVVQRWEIHPPEPVMPITIHLAGIINTASGAVALNGRTAGGANAHVVGRAELSGTGQVSIGGELMFNPQPEPPAR